MAIDIPKMSSGADIIRGKLAPDPNKQLAMRKLVRNRETGRVEIKIVDAKTGEEVNDLSNYNVINTSGFMALEDLGISPTQDPTEKSVSQEVVQNTVQEDLGQNSSPNGRNEVTGQPRSPANNYGYVNAPRALGFISMMPGPVGMAGKMTRAAVNVNNAVAAQDARRGIGIREKGLAGFIGEAIRGNKGQIDNVQYADNLGNVRTSPVGFTAKDQVGRTNLTPNEARMRNMLSKDFDVATAQETRQAKNAFSKANNTGGLFSGVRSAAANLFGSIFGDDTKANTPASSGSFKANTTLGEHLGYTGGSNSGKSSSTGYGKGTSYGGDTGRKTGFEGSPEMGGQRGKSSSSGGNDFGGSAQADAARGSAGLY